MLTAEQFHYAFGNTLSEEASRAAYERYAVPGPDQSSSRPAWRTSTRTPRPLSISATTTARRCS